jgi:hypothetical protein
MYPLEQRESRALFGERRNRSTAENDEQIGTADQGSAKSMIRSEKNREYRETATSSPQRRNHPQKPDVRQPCDERIQP